MFDLFAQPCVVGLVGVVLGLDSVVGFVWLSLGFDVSCVPSVKVGVLVLALLWVCKFLFDIVSFDSFVQVPLDLSFENECLKLKALYLLIKGPQSKKRGLEMSLFVIFSLPKFTRVLVDFDRFLLDIIFWW